MSASFARRARSSLHQAKRSVVIAVRESSLARAKRRACSVPREPFLPTTKALAIIVRQGLLLKVTEAPARPVLPGPTQTKLGRRASFAPSESSWSWAEIARTAPRDTWPSLGRPRATSVPADLRQGPKGQAHVSNALLGGSRTREETRTVQYAPMWVLSAPVVSLSPSTAFGQTTRENFPKRPKSSSA